MVKVQRATALSSGPIGIPEKQAAEESTAAENFRSLSSVTEAIASDIESASYDGYQDVLPKMNLGIACAC